MRGEREGRAALTAASPLRNSTPRSTIVEP